MRNPPFLLTWLCSLCLPLFLRWLILCIYTDCGSRPAFPVRRWYCPPILSERQSELHFSLRRCTLWSRSLCYLQGSPSWGCLQPPLRVPTHHSTRTPPFENKRLPSSPGRAPSLLSMWLPPIWAWNQGLVNQTSQGREGGRTRPWVPAPSAYNQTFHPQSNSRDAFSDTVPISKKSTPKWQHFQQRTRAREASYFQW